MNKQELSQLIKEELNKISLAECFLNHQWESFYNKFPQYIKFIKDDPIVKEKGFGYTHLKIDSSDADYYNELGYMGGTYCGSSPSDFTYDGISKFFNTLVRKEVITEETKDKILFLAKKYFNNYQKYIDDNNIKAELGYLTRGYLFNLKKRGEEKAIKILKLDLKMTGLSPKYNITIDDVLSSIKTQ